VLRADVVVPEVAGLFHRELEHLLGARPVKGSWPIVTIEGPVLTIFSTSALILLRSMPMFFSTLAATSAAFLDEAEQDVLGAQVFVG